MIQSCPVLTSVELLPDLIGTAAVDMVIERRQKKRESGKTIIISPVLMDRGSVNSKEALYENS